MEQGPGGYRESTFPFFEKKSVTEVGVLSMGLVISNKGYTGAR